MQPAERPVIPVILAGGAGERLWPLSKVDYPKQFIAFDADNRSLFQDTLMRVADRSRFAAPVVVCNEEHRFIVSDQLREMGCTDAAVIVEPVARNTAPALALAALHVEATQGVDAVMLAMPADHRIRLPERLLATVDLARDAAAAGRVVTFAITPETPETGYGYIRRGAALVEHPGIYAIERFVEKPDMATALGYLADPAYGWNSGMFLVQVGALLMQYERHAHSVYEHSKQAYEQRMLDRTFIRPDGALMLSCPAISFDYAIMEKTDRGAVTAVAMGWSDLGSWAALDGQAEKDGHGNACIGRHVTHDVQGCYIRTEKALVAAIGLRDMVIIAADNAIMVGPKDRMQEVKQLLRQMRETAIPDTHRTSFTHRPWGGFYTIERQEHYQVKKLRLKPGGKISLQSHVHRSEHWIIVEGCATVTCDGLEQELSANQSTYIQAGKRHRLENRGVQDLIVIEVQTGAYLGEDDIERFDDAYERN